MYSILLDSSSSYLAVGIAKDNTLIKGVFYEAWQQQSEFMVVELNKLLTELKISISEIDSVVVSIGPGSYTGVRISITIAKTLALALNVKIYAISSLWAEACFDKPSICLINARSSRSYIGVYHQDKCILKDQIMKNEDVLKYIENHKDFAICGDVKYLGITSDNVKVLEQLAIMKNYLKPVENFLALKPIYMCD